MCVALTSELRSIIVVIHKYVGEGLNKQHLPFFYEEVSLHYYEGVSFLEMEK